MGPVLFRLYTARARPCTHCRSAGRRLCSLCSFVLVTVSLAVWRQPTASERCTVRRRESYWLGWRGSPLHKVPFGSTKSVRVCRHWPRQPGSGCSRVRSSVFGPTLHVSRGSWAQRSASDTTFGSAGRGPALGYMRLAVELCHPRFPARLRSAFLSWD